MIPSLKKSTEEKMGKSIESLKREFSRIRTGRATPAILDGITVDYYGSMVSISQVANITIPEPRLVVVQPWEKPMIGAIEKAIQTSDLGLNPQNDGNVVRIPIPALTEDRRKELVKSAKKIAENAKISIRNIRRDSNDTLKKYEKNKDITQDEQKLALDDIQKITDKYIKIVDETLALKETDIMDV